MTNNETVADVLAEMRQEGVGEHVGKEWADRIQAAHAREVEALRKDAARWRHARRILTIDDIEGAQGAHDSYTPPLVDEKECLRADAAIDAAMEAKL